MKKTGSRLTAIFLAALLVFLFTACSTPAEEGTKASKEAPVTIQMYGFLDSAYLPFLNKLSETFPEANLEYEFQWDEACYSEPERRLLHDDGPDLMVIRGDVLSSTIEKGGLLDLTNEPFVSKYHVSTMNNLNSNGKIYALPLPSELNCLIYNPKILEEHGITNLPQTLDELFEMDQKLLSEGQKGVLIEESFYNMLLYTSFLNKPEGYAWIKNYNNGNATMKGTKEIEDIWETIQKFAQSSGTTPEDAGKMPAGRTELMVKGEYAFRVNSTTNLQYMLAQDPSLSLRAMPLLGKTPEDQWVYYSAYKSAKVFAANAALDREENAAKKEIVLKMLAWISSQEGQQLLADCGSAALGYVDGVTLEQNEKLSLLQPTIQSGHVTTPIGFERGVNSVIQSSILDLLGKKRTIAEVIDACDAQNAAYQPPEAVAGIHEVIGSAAENILWRKPFAVTTGTPMPQLAAQAMAEAFPEADFAFAMAKNVATSLYAGDLTLGDVIDCANGEQNSPLVMVKATGATIKEVMEMGIGSPKDVSYILPNGISGAGRLLYPVGLRYKADINRENGDKITEIILDDGSPLEPNKTYTLVVSKLLVDTVAEPNFKDSEVTATDLYLKDVMIPYIRNHPNLKAPKVAFEITGASDGAKTLE